MIIQRIIRIPVLSLMKAQPDQLLGIIGISARKVSGQELFVNGELMYPVNLIPGEKMNEKPETLQVAPKGKTFIFLVNENLTKLKQALYINRLSNKAKNAHKSAFEILLR